MYSIPTPGGAAERGGEHDDFDIFVLSHNFLINIPTLTEKAPAVFTVVSCLFCPFRNKHILTVCWCHFRSVTVWTAELRET